MKNFLLSLVMLLIMTNQVWSGEVKSQQNNGQQQAEIIYNECNNSIAVVEEKDVIAGNIADVKRARLIRKCIKDNIFKQASAVLQASQLDSFKQSVNTYENTLAEIYQDLFFCTDYQDEFWCQERTDDDMSLAKLVLENKLTDEMYKLLTDVLDAKEGTLIF